MTKLRVYMARATQADRNTTVASLYDAYKTIPSEDLRHLDFRIYDTSVSKKFIQELKDSLDSPNPQKTIEHNTYTYNYFNETLETLQQEMNDSNQELNRLIAGHEGCYLDPVPEWMKLRIDKDDRQIQMLNAMHRYFEDQSYKMIADFDFDFRNKFFSHLEKINQLVHTMENWTAYEEKQVVSFFASIRLVPKQNPVELTDEDYNTFSMMERWGGLQLDYATVGKDLWGCANSNDMDLVRAGEVKQQLYINPNFSFGFKNIGDTPQRELEGQKKIVEEFCIKNNVEQYGYNWREPKYNPGRAQLGVIDTDLTEQQMIEQLKVFHKVVGVEIINE